MHHAVVVHVTQPVHALKDSNAHQAVLVQLVLSLLVERRRRVKLVLLVLILVVMVALTVFYAKRENIKKILAQPDATPVRSVSIALIKEVILRHYVFYVQSAHIRIKQDSHFVNNVLYLLSQKLMGARRHMTVMYVQLESIIAHLCVKRYSLL